MGHDAGMHALYEWAMVLAAKTLTEPLHTSCLVCTWDKANRHLPTCCFFTRNRGMWLELLQAAGTGVDACTAKLTAGVQAAENEAAAPWAR
jgi:hypothetical protein